MRLVCGLLPGQSAVGATTLVSGLVGRTRGLICAILAIRFVKPELL